MDKEKLLMEISGMDREMKVWKDKSETDPDKKAASVAKMDVRRVQRKYKELLLNLSDSDCEEIKNLAAVKGIELIFFDELNCSEEEKKQIKEQRDADDKKAQKNLEEIYSKYPDNYRSILEEAAKDTEPKKKKGLFGLFGK